MEVATEGDSRSSAIHVQQTPLFNFIDQSVAAAARKITLAEDGIGDEWMLVAVECVGDEFNKMANPKLNRDGDWLAWSAEIIWWF